ncbi:MAG: hypothetical protein K0Q57_1006 [Gammaproteobacteria bacterium]|nr:hypothetical protein [Gammaproteobacteria bacterium]
MHQPRSQQDRGLFLGLFALYACFRLYAFYLLPRHGYIFSHDAAQYLEYAHCSLISPCLYIDRPFIFPLFIKIWGYHYFCLTWAQCCISIMAWGFLAYSMKQSMQTRLLARFIFCFILIYSCAAYLILWDTKALTESLSVSFLVCFIAFYLIGLRTQFSIKSIVGLMLFGFLLVNIRDSNSYLFLLAGIGTGIASFISKNIPKKPALILLAFSIMVFLFSTWTANLGLRWLEPISDLLY